MEFSMIFEAQMVDPSPESEQRVLHDSVEQAVLADKLGFDRVWAVEHHCLTQYAHMSAPETFLAFVAGKTSNVRIGHGVVCLPFKMNHPIKVAERVAMLDVLSNGRMDFGVGKGGTETEAGSFDVHITDMDELIEASFRMIPDIWSSDVFSYESDIIRIPPRAIHPKPMQKPHPPLFMACTRESTLNQAGEWGVGALCLGFGGPEDVAQKNKVYREAIKRRTPESQVGAFATDRLSALCPAIVLDDGVEARAIGHRGQRFFTESINHFYQGGPAPGTPPEDEDAAEYLKKQGEAFVAYLHEEKIEAGTEATGLYNPNHAYGTVADAIAYVERLEEAGADEVMFLIQMGSVPQKAALRTIELLAEEVLPRFR
jgi:alkanesulfonate monooxygenase SsuD/methylene tetrahydromethanopterin reductase-like flavin-dependent oxidoreductase (luciferase family)